MSDNAIKKLRRIPCRTPWVTRDRRKITIPMMPNGHLRNLHRRISFGKAKGTPNWTSGGFTRDEWLAHIEAEMIRRWGTIGDRIYPLAQEAYQRDSAPVYDYNPHAQQDII